jgi:hypothetical protein
VPEDLLSDDRALNTVTHAEVLRSKTRHCPCSVPQKSRLSPRAEYTWTQAVRCPGRQGLVSCVRSLVEESHPKALPSSVNANTCAATPATAAFSPSMALSLARRESKSTATPWIGLEVMHPAGTCREVVTLVLVGRNGPVRRDMTLVTSTPERER